MLLQQKILKMFSKYTLYCKSQPFTRLLNEVSYRGGNRDGGRDGHRDGTRDGNRP